MSNKSMTQRFLYEEFGIVHNATSWDSSSLGWMQDGKWEKRSPVALPYEIVKAKEFWQILKISTSQFVCALSPKWRTYQSPGRQQTKLNLETLKLGPPPDKMVNNL